MERQFFSGNTIEQAVMAAARHYGLDPSRVAYKVRDKKHGFLNIRRRVVIEVDPSAPGKTFEEPPPRETSTRESSVQEKAGAPVGEDPRPVRRSSPEEDAFREPDAEVATKKESRHGEGGAFRRDRSGGDVSSETELLREELLEDFAAETEESDKEERELIAFETALDETLALMDADVDGTVERTDDLFEIEITGPDSDLLTDEDGRLLRAIEHLLPRLVRGLLGYGLPCTVDCDGFQSDRESELRELAGGMAELVRRQGTPKRLDPMNPADRRIVHMALADDSTVRTESEGDGYMKRVEILPV